MHAFTTVLQCTCCNALEESAMLWQVRVLWKGVFLVLHDSRSHEKPSETPLHCERLPSCHLSLQIFIVASGPWQVLNSASASASQFTAKAVPSSLSPMHKAMHQKKRPERLQVPRVRRVPQVMSLCSAAGCLDRPGQGI